MASNPDREVLSAQMCINLVFTRVSGIFRSSTSFPCPESFSAPLGAIKCLSPTRAIQITSSSVPVQQFVGLRIVRGRSGSVRVAQSLSI